LYKPILSEPKPLLTQTPKLLGLDGRKMSKTYGNTINLSDPESIIRKKVQSMFTDPQRIKRTDAGRPEVCNVHNYFAVFALERKARIEDDCKAAKIGCTECKKILGSVLVDLLEPIQRKRKELLKNKKRLKNILQLGAQKARKTSSKTIDQIKRSVFKNGL